MPEIPSKKPSKVGATILEALDDLSAAVDGFGRTLSVIDKLLTDIDARLISLEDTVARMPGEVRDTVQEEFRHVESTIEDVNCKVEEIGQTTELISEHMYNVDEIADNLRREELNKIRFEARAAMGKVKFVQLMG